MKHAFQIGHYTDLENITGCTVILCPAGTIASCHVSGAAPGSRELALLAPDKKMESIHALFLTGGSAFGLGAADGVMRYLRENDIGYSTPYGKIPIVPAAVIYDLNIGSNKIHPVADNAYQACHDAGFKFNRQGCIGAATGATVGKWAGLTFAMKSGMGIHTITLGTCWITALSIVNAVGDIIDSQGKIIAGAVDHHRAFLAGGGDYKRWLHPQVGFGQNTVLSVLLTNVKLTKLQAYLLACRAQNGLARAVIPANTSYDGDVIFVLSHGEENLDLEITAEMGTDALRTAIIESVLQASGLGGFLAAAELPK
jgi:L-aminopeptidase/D-esterase-like protein